MSTAEPLRRVDEALRAARAAGVDRLDAQLLLAAVLTRPRPWLLAHGDVTLTADAARRFDALLARRQAGEPLAYLLGEKEFFGLPLKVTPAVLVPRPDTEVLVEWALERLAERNASPGPARVLDLGTGSGAVALAMAQRAPQARVTAVDASEAALAVAAENGRSLGLPIEWRRGNWFSPVAGQRFDLVVSNPPYIAEGDPHLPALVHEPRSALVSGPDGLADLRAIVAGAPAHLMPGAWLLFEHGHDQSDAVGALLYAAGFADVTTRRDLATRPRCTGGRWPG